MKAADVMTAAVVTVPADATLSDVARRLVLHGIGALPVVDDAGVIVGMISDGDLIGHREGGEGQHRRPTWLEMLVDGNRLGPDLLNRLRPGDRVAKDVMTPEVVTVHGDTSLEAIAGLLDKHRIKRVPVQGNDGRPVGIVSRANLVHALAQAAVPEQGRRAMRPWTSRLASVVVRALAPKEEGDAAAEPPSSQLPGGPFTVTVQRLRELEETYWRVREQERTTHRQAEAEQRAHAVREAISRRLTAPQWRAALSGMQSAAARGEREYQVLTLPSDACSDGGRTINNAEAGWGATLRGEAADLYRRWEAELRSSGFRIAARVLNYPGGFPGDIGLFVIWD